MLYKKSSGNFEISKFPLNYYSKYAFSRLVGFEVVHLHNFIILTQRFPLRSSQYA